MFGIYYAVVTSLAECKTPDLSMFNAHDVYQALLPIYSNPVNWKQFKDLVNKTSCGKVVILDEKIDAGLGINHKTFSLNREGKPKLKIAFVLLGEPFEIFE